MLNPRPKIWARSEYERMVDAGILGPGERVELLEGEIVEMSPEASRHAAAIDLTAEALRTAFGSGFTVRVQHPLVLREISEPEPAVAVVAGSPRDYAAAHPTAALLVVEVADTSLDYDRRRKAIAYARAAIDEYWILNLVDLRLEACRQPSASGYLSPQVLGREASVSPLAAPHAVIGVADLLP